MYRNSTSPEQQQAPRPAPEPSGRELAVFERPGGKWGPDTELRVVFDEFEGHSYVGLRVWSKGPDGTWFPTKKGLSIKIKELHNLAATLTEAAGLVDAPEARAAPRREQRRPGPAPRRERAGDRRQGGLPLAGSATQGTTWAQDFDEFNG